MGKLLNDCEAKFFDKIAAELNELAGTEVNLYAMNAKTGKVDPLYGEHTERVPNGPYRVMAVVEWPQVSIRPGEPGFGLEFDSIAYIARSALETAGAPYPSAGDILEMWRTPFHDAYSRGKGMFFDILKSENDGHVNDTPTFVQFKLTLKRRTQFGAERRITPP